ncbi:MAG: hypothetical protein EA406_01325 [Rhodospirillales bacterium]|nr:MAG: hypothetical protein EA406_01325 [Rhodospirillales bacterium]
MATRDITRQARSRANRYQDLHAQQGRLFTDADQIEQAELRFEAERQTRIDTIGPYGSPDGGFRISSPTVVGGQIDFTIGAGVLYLGGLRLERLAGETFRLQSDWLNNPGAAPPGPGETRRDLAVALTWLQPVAATEDRETLEPGLGGPDTAVRLRPVTRIVLVEGVAADTCEDAWAEVADRFHSEGLGAIDPTFELIPDTAITIGLAPGSGGDDLCAPAVDGGYLGAENQAIRVTLLGGDRFIWGFDNAAPLYRVVVEAGGTTIRFLTEPKDALHWPAQGQTIEVIPWGAVLANGEKLADEGTPGHFAQVEGAYNPDTREITLTAATAVPAGFGTEWQGRADAAGLLTTRYGLEPLDGPYYFLRVWDRGTDTGPEPTLPLLPAPVALGSTGLTVAVVGSDRRPGDHVIVAARPATPDVVLPWELLTGIPPMGMRRFAAPLALLEWSGGTGTVLHDCRPPFQPLTRVRGCCTYTVGDGTTSFGDFSSIQAAIDALPVSGGRICVLPGRFFERIRLTDLHGVRITGCGRRSRIVAPDGTTDPLVLITGGSGIQIDDLAFESPFGLAIEARGRPEQDRVMPIEDLRLLRLIIAARDRGAIAAHFVDALTIAECEISIGLLQGDLAAVAPAGQAPAVFAQGDDMVIADNAIRTEGERAIVRAAGGLQIGGGSDHVLIRNNVIAGGNGNGITLGHIVMLTREQAARLADNYWLVAVADPLPVGSAITIADNGCIIYIPPGTGGDPDSEPELFPVSGGDLSDVVIRDNRIADMGLSGIASPLAISPRGRRPVMVTVRGLQVDRNIITGCALLETPELPADIRLFVAFGGISLLVVEIGVFAGNVVEANGRRHIDAICGISVIRAESLSILDNRIVDNGPRTDSEGTPRTGLRGGIRIGLAAPQSSSFSSAQEVAAIRRLDQRFAAARTLSVPALTIHDNVVHQPVGKSLSVMGAGPMSIVGNHFASQGNMSGSLESLFAEIFAVVSQGGGAGEILFILVERLLGTAVTVINTGISSELIEGLAILSLAKGHSNHGIATHEVAGPRVPTEGWAGAARLIQGGAVLFNDNTVIQNFLDGTPSLTLCSVFAMTLDDLSVQDNVLVSQVDFGTDFSMMNLLAFAWSVRACGNRFQETLLRTLNSAVTLGFYNDTSHNQATHCIEVRGPAVLRVDAPNRILMGALHPLACGGCLNPPFTGLAMEARDQNGNIVTPRLETMMGTTGLWFGTRLLITLPGTVERIDLDLLGQDVAVHVMAQSATGTVQERVLEGLAGPVSLTLAGSGISQIRIEASAERILLTRLCTDRPRFGPASGAVSGSSYLAWGG